MRRWLHHTRQVIVFVVVVMGRRSNDRRQMGIATGDQRRDFRLRRRSARVKRLNVMQFHERHELRRDLLQCLSS
jgi:hypothetical protein